MPRLILLILAAAAVYLIGNGSVSLWDRDEPRYAQTSRQMLASGDWVVPTLLDEPREKKPVFIYWCQAAAMAVFGQNTFAARLPSVLFVTVTLITIAAAVWKNAGRQRALWTAFIFATAALTIASAKMCITDGVLILFVVVAQLCLYAILNGHASWPIVIACGLANGLGPLTKGPVVPAVMLMTALALAALCWIDRRRGQGKRLRDSAAPTSGRPWLIVLAKWLIAIALAVAVFAPWWYAIEQRLPGWTMRTLRNEVLERAAKPQEGHKGPPGYYLLTIWGTYFPWSLLLPATMVSAWQRRHLPRVRFALAAAAGPWVMFELVATKLPHYLLPAFPPLAFLTADMLVRAARRAQRWRSTRSAATPGEADALPSAPFADKWFLRVVLVWAVVIGLIGLAPWLAVVEFGFPPPLAVAASILLPVLAAAYGALVYNRFRAARPLEAAAVMGTGMLVLIAVLNGLYLPRAPYLRIAERVAQVLKDQGATGPGDAVMIDYKETSLAFYQGGTIRPQRDNELLVKTEPKDWPGWVVMTDAVWKTMPQRVKQQMDVVASIRGLNYAGKDEDRKHVITVHVLRRRAAPLSLR